MDKSELKIKLVSDGIRREMFSLDGGLANETYCLDYNADDCIWEVYYSERGNKSSLNKFVSEQDACNYFYKLIKDGEYV